MNTNETLLHDVFISCSSEDIEIATRMASEFKTQGLTYFLYTRDVHAGEVWPKILGDAVERARILAVVWSCSASSSEWVQNEILLAKKLNLGIVPLQIEEVPGDILLINRTPIDASQDLEKALAELTECIQRLLHEQDPGIAEPCDATPESGLLWRLAYIFLRTDQLPSGGWGKSLRPWVQRLGYPEPRDQGGLTVTISALHLYLDFLRRTRPGQVPLVEMRNRVCSRVVQFLKGRRGLHGGIDSMGGRVSIHHTLIGLACYLLEAQSNQWVLRERDARDLAAYLKANLARWESEPREKSRALGILCTGLMLVDLLGDPGLEIGARSGCAYLEEIRVEIERVIDTLSNYVCHNTGNPPFFAIDPATCRSDFVMNLLLVIRDGHLIERACACQPLRNHFVTCTSELLCEVEPFEENAPAKSLVRFSASQNCDWGLSVGLLAALKAQELRDALDDFGAEAVADRIEWLESACFATLLRCDAFPEVFFHSNAVNLAQALALPPARHMLPGAIDQLDRLIEDVLAHGATEFRLSSCVAAIAEQTNIGSLHNRTCDTIKNLLMERIEAGEHTPDTSWCKESTWSKEVDEAIDTTKKFFEGKGGEMNAQKNRDAILRFLVTRLRDYTPEWWKDSPPDTRLGKSALDLGCGDGLYAEVLHDMGFDVTLLDFSAAMLRRAENNLRAIGITKVECLSIEDLHVYSNRRSNNSRFHVVFASAVLFHIRRKKVPKFLNDCFKLLTPGGMLFVNIKIGDHTLISRDGRFFEYYRDAEVLARLIRAAGFEICETGLREKHHNMYDMSLTTHWANFYCRRPAEEPVSGASIHAG